MTYNLFPTLIESYDLSDHPDLDAFKKVIKEKGETSKHDLAVNGVSSHGGWDPLDDDDSAPMAVAFQECLLDYTSKLGQWPVIISGSWYNILPPGGFTHRHRHESSVISGAFYLKLPEGDFGQFYVINPVAQHFMCMHYFTNTPYSTYEYNIDIKENHLYLFPSWLEHGSRVNNTEDDRVTVSFNTNPCHPDYIPDNYMEYINSCK